MEIKNKVLIHNRFDIEVRDAVTNELRQEAVAYNIILTQMYTRLCGGLAYFTNIHFGSGSGTLSPSRTTLFNHLGTKTAVDDTLIRSIPLSSWRRRIVLNPEEFVGNTISEVGVAFGATNTNLVTHSTLRDSEGNPISILKRDVDVVTIFATVFVTFDNSNPNLRYIGMPSSNALVNYLIGGGTAPTGAFGLNDISFGQTLLGSSPTVTWTSDTANRRRATNVVRFGTTVGNGHVRFLEFLNLFSLRFPSVNVFNGQAYAGVSLGVGDGVRNKVYLPSANVVQGSVRMRVNGVEVPHVIDAVVRGVARADIPRNASFQALPSVQGISFSYDGRFFAFGMQSSVWMMIGMPTEAGISWRTTSGLVLGATPVATALNRDGSILAYIMSSSIRIAVFNGTVWVPMSAPSVSGTITDVKLNGDGNVLFVTRHTTPFILVFDWNGSAWVQRANPSVLPGQADMCAVIEDGLVMAVSSQTSPFFSVYDWVGGVWVRRGTPTQAPVDICLRIRLSSTGNVVAISQQTSPFIIVYDWVGGVWVRRPNINVLPTQSPGIALSGDGRTLWTAGHADSFTRLHRWDDFGWVLDSVSPHTWSSSAMNLQGSHIVLGFNDVNGVRVQELLPFLLIRLSTPPASGAVITADYTVDGVHKTDQFVIDASFSIQFGEVV